MKYLQIEQKSTEWWDYKVGKVSGTRFGELISTRENSLIDELVNEMLDCAIYQDDFVTDEMQFGIDNEEAAINAYELLSGIKFKRGGVIESDYSKMHMASPDGVNDDNPRYVIIAETKCTTKGKIQIRRFRKGVDPSYLPQVINYFAVSDDVKEVHWFSYCPFRPERELVPIIFKRDTVIESKNTKRDGLVEITIQDKVDEGLKKLPILEKEVKELMNEFKQLKF